MKNFIFSKLFSFSFLLLIILISLPSYAFATGVWTQQTASGSRAWRDIASSADGMKLVAIVFADYIYTSTDGGVTWSTQSNSSGIHNWRSVTSSADGTKLAVAENTGYIWTSVDSGATWTQQTSSGSRTWLGIASSADGVKLVASVTNGYIYTSVDSGVTWVQSTTSGSRGWYGVASSADGVKLAAVDELGDGYGGYVYTSTDSGATWVARTNPGVNQWGNITSSYDGTKLAAGITGSGGYEYTSVDSGMTWTAQTASGYRTWRNSALSGDGNILAASANSPILISSSPYSTWNMGTPNSSWIGLAVSSDGSRIAANTIGGYVYTYLNTVIPTLTTQAATSVGSSTVNLNGTILETEGYNPTVRGFQYGLTTGYGSTITENGSFSAGSFVSNISSLTCSTTYHYRAYAINSIGTGYGEDATFTTNACPNISTVITDPASSITPTTVVLNGNIIDNGGEVTTRGFNYGLTSSYGTDIKESGLFSNGAYTSNLSSLVCSTIYHYSAYTINSAGTSHGEDMNFTTSPCPTLASITTSPATSIKEDKATLNGVIIDNGSEFTIFGFEYGIDLSYGSQLEYGTSSISSYSSPISSLICSTTYHYRAYATNSAGIGYGADKTFKTNVCTNFSSKYIFTSSLNTYVPIREGTVLGTGMLDDEVFEDKSIGFTFNYNSIDYSNFSVNNNGYIAMGSTVQTNYNSPISSNNGSNAISALGNDLQGNNDSELSYETSGTAPNRILTIEWSNYREYGRSNQNLNFQIKLYETSNVIEFVYGNFTPSYTTYYQVGLRGSTNTDFLNRTSSTEWTNTIAGSNNSDTMTLESNIYPTSGLTYTYTPIRIPSISSVTTFPASFITTTTAVLNGDIIDNGGEVETRGFNYGLTSSYGTDTTESGSFSNGAYTSNLSLLTCKTTYHYRAYSTNSAGTGYGEDATFTTSACPSEPNITSISIPTASRTSSGSSALFRYNHLLSIGNMEAAEKLKKEFPNQIVVDTVNSLTPVLSSSTTRILRYKMKGDDVKSLQEYLNKAGYNCGKVDGIFGKATLSAVKKFQFANLLAIDGIVGPSTSTAINKIN